jgi:hypothetical protein
VQIDEQFRPKPKRATDRPSRLDQTPSGLFADFLAEQNVSDERVAGLFAELLEDVTGGQD